MLVWSVQFGEKALQSFDPMHLAIKGSPAPHPTAVDTKFLFSWSIE